MAELRPVDRRFGRRAADRQAGGWLQAAAVLRAILVFGAVVAVAWLVYAVRSVILLLVLSVFFAYLLAPLVSLVQRPWALYGRPRRLSPALAVGAVYLLLLGFLVLAGAAVGPRVTAQGGQLMSQAPTYMKAVEAHAQSFAGLLDRLGLPPAARDAAQRGLTSVAGSLQATAAHAGTVLLGLASYVPWLVLIPILAFFLLKDADTFRMGAIGVLPDGRPRLHAAALLERVNVVLAAYIRAQLLACLLIAVVTGVGFAVIGVPYAIVLGALAGLAEFVPLVGPLVVAVVAALIAAVHAPILAIWVLAFLATIRVLQDYVVYPRLVGGGMDLHPLTIIIAVLAGAELGGVPGIFLAVPVVAILIVTVRYFRPSTEQTIAARDGVVERRSA